MDTGVILTAFRRIDLAALIQTYLIMVVTMGTDRKRTKARKLMLQVLRISCDIIEGIRSTDIKGQAVRK